MASPHNFEAVRKLELEILQQLCDLPDDPPLRARAHALCQLARHEWKDADHRVVFDALRRTAGRDPTLLREQLPAEATRLGFPDVEWSAYFHGPSPGNRRSTEQLMRELLDASGEAPGGK